MNMETNILFVGVLSSHDVAQLSRSVIKTVEGVPVTLEDIADVKIGSQEPKLVLLRREENLPYC